MDNTVRVWDLSDFSEIGALEGHTNQVCVNLFFMIDFKFNFEYYF